MSQILVYITCKDLEEARHISKILVREKLVACANIHSPIQSVYEWDGEVCEGEEYGVILKTCLTRYDALEGRIKSLPSYDVPCIIQLPTQGGSQEYLAWISEQTH